MSPGDLVRLPFRAWDTFWFHPTSPRNLAGTRICVSLAMLLFLLQRSPFDPSTTLAAVAWLPDELWMPRKIVQWARLGPPTLGQIQAVWVACLVATSASLLGVFTRLATASMALLGLYLLVIPNCWGKINHGGNVVGMCLLILPLVPSGAAWFVDAWRRGRDGSGLSPHHTWPVKLCQLSFALMLFFATYNKLTKSGLEWIFSANLRNNILAQHWSVPSPDPNALAMWVAAEPWRYQAAALGAVVTQALFVLIVFFENKWLRAIWLSFGVGFVVGLHILMNLPNPILLVTMGIFLPWQAIAERVAARRAA